MMQGRVQTLIRDGAPAADVLRFEAIRLGDVAHRAALMHADKVQEESSIKHSIFEKLTELVAPEAKFSSDQFTVVENCVSEMTERSLRQRDASRSTESGVDVAPLANYVNNCRG
jgi:hypothetical protein